MHTLLKEILDPPLQKKFLAVEFPTNCNNGSFSLSRNKKNKLETIQWKKLRKWNVIIKRLICKQFVQVSSLCGPQFPSYLPKGFMHLCRALCGLETPFWWGFAKTRPVARGPQPTTCDGPAVPRPSGRAARRPGARFSNVPIINGPGKLSPFTLKIEVLIVLHLTR